MADYDVSVVSLRLESTVANTVDILWRIKNNDTQSLTVYSDVHIGGEYIESFSEELTVGETFDYWETYDGIPAENNMECCVEATGADPRIV